jgi:hypothetical protein
VVGPYVCFLLKARSWSVPGGGHPGSVCTSLLGLGWSPCPTAFSVRWPRLPSCQVEKQDSQLKGRP